MEPAPTPTERWVTFRRDSEVGPSFLFANLALDEFAPVADAPICTRLHLGLPQLSDGGAVDIDWTLLNSIDDALRGLNAVEAGRVTNAAGREYIFYSDNGAATEAAIRERLTSFPDLSLTTESAPDPQWAVWTVKLCPTPAEVRQINDESVLRALANDGDDGTAARTVLHWAYFEDAAAADHFATVAEQEGFMVLANEPTDEDANAPAGRVVQLAKPQALANGLITQTTLHLIDLANRSNGTYDGWETQLVKGCGE